LKCGSTKGVKKKKTLNVTLLGAKKPGPEHKRGIGATEFTVGGRGRGKR